MTYVVTRPCIGTKDRSCVEVCPVDCFYNIKKKFYNEKYGVPVDGEDGDDAVGLLIIHPDECINCGACETECPVEAIYEDSSVPEEFKEFIAINEEEANAMSDEELEANRCTAK
ncbi:MAG: ferredoxin family protein [Candidatus Dadabacteria bacterium]|nr:MAG: ferredoxin family protein [Candidatus Dadabacteria bacterium]